MVVYRVREKGEQPQEQWCGQASSELMLENVIYSEHAACSLCCAAGSQAKPLLAVRGVLQKAEPSLCLQHPF